MRLIDADELRAWLVKAGRFLKLQDDKRTASHAIGKIIDHIDKIPAVDAVPVIRCRDCIHRQRDEYPICMLHTEPYANAIGYRGDAVFVEMDDFCSRGEAAHCRKAETQKGAAR